MPNSDTGKYQEAWKRFQDARRKLYVGTGSGAEFKERGVFTPRGLTESTATDLLSASAELRSVLDDATKSDDSDLRDLAAIKLLAGAAYDLSVAGDLFRQGKSVAETERGVSLDPEMLVELNDVLDAPLSPDGFRQFVRIDRAALPTEFGPACDELDKKITKYLKDIPENAISLAGSALTGAFSFATPASGWESALGHEFLDNVAGGVPWAARLAVEGIQKLWSALGKDQKSQLLDEAKGWLKDAKAKGTQSLADWLYQIPALDASVHAKVKSAQPAKTDYARINNGTRRLDQLLGRYSKTTKLLGWVLKGIEFCKAPLLAAAPWGPVAAYAIYVLVFGYAAYSGGDYLDSPRFSAKWLDLVQGLDRTVTSAVC